MPEHVFYQFCLGRSPGRQALASYIPPLKRVGFTGLFIKNNLKSSAEHNLGLNQGIYLSPSHPFLHPAKIS
jgi:hypothetical protein